MAADPDPYFALPKLYGGPAYARPPRAVEETERPFDPDDLPIAAARMSDEQTLTEAPFTAESYHSIGTNLLLAAVAPASPPVGARHVLGGDRSRDRRSAHPRARPVRMAPGSACGP